MDVRILEYFLVVTREENITKAAELLYVTQPTLSRQLIQLEEELGVKLFHRGKHKIVLTNDGLLLKRRAQEIVLLLNKAKQELTHKEEILTGEIAIGCGEIYNMKSLAQILNSFRKKHPLVRFSIFSAVADDVKDRMDNGVLDIGLFVEPIDIIKYEFIRMPLKETWGIVVNRNSHLAQKEFISPEDLLGTPIIIPKRETVQNELSNWFGYYYAQLNIIANYNLLNNAAVMAEENLGVVLCLRRVNFSKKLRFIPLSPQLETGAILAWMKHQNYPCVTDQFIKHIKNYYRGLMSSDKE